jgi:hypothetical protein
MGEVKQGHMCMVVVWFFRLSFELQRFHFGFLNSEELLKMIGFWNTLLK